MSRLKTASTSDLAILLKARGPTSGPEIAAKLAISQPTLSRLIREAKGEVIRLEVGRPPLYALKRDIRNLGNPIPVFKINEIGKSISLGTLIPIHANGFVLQDEKPEIFPGIPYFLSDNRPQGFIGKTFPLRHPDLNLPNRVQDWSEEDFIEAMCRRGEDSIGNIIVGRESFDRFQKNRLNPKAHLESRELLNHYVNAANNTLGTEYPGSSAAGEQPKFTASYRSGNRVINVLVKFSPKRDSATSIRWADLLQAEHIALKTLKDAKIEVCESRILESDNRIFLETERFDRTGDWGRIGVISLASLDDEFWGKRDSWVNASFRMVNEGLIEDADGKRMRVLSAYSDLIGNTDQHFGNLSFFFEPKRRPLKLTPAYDILPMFYAPVNNEIVPRVFKIATPNADDIDAWETALPMAVKFWEGVTENKKISDGFRTIAAENLKSLAQLL